MTLQSLHSQRIYLLSENLSPSNLPTQSLRNLRTFFITMVPACFFLFLLLEGYSKRLFEMFFYFSEDLMAFYLGQGQCWDYYCYSIRFLIFYICCQISLISADVAAIFYCTTLLILSSSPSSFYSTLFFFELVAVSNHLVQIFFSLCNLGNEVVLLYLY